MGSADWRAAEGVGEREMNSFDTSEEGVSTGISSLWGERVTSRLSRCEGKQECTMPVE